jgi:hypothetical protein
LLFLSPRKKCKYLQYAIKLANKRNEKRLSAITELTTIMTEDKLPKIDTGQIKEEKEEGDGRDREREWNYKNNNHHHITHNTNVSLSSNEISRGFSFVLRLSDRRLKSFFC